VKDRRAAQREASDAKAALEEAETERAEAVAAMRRANSKAAEDAGRLHESKARLAELWRRAENAEDELRKVRAGDAGDKAEQAERNAAGGDKWRGASRLRTKLGSEEGEAAKSPIVAEAQANAAAAMAIVRDAQAALATARDTVHAERAGAHSVKRGGGKSKADARAAALQRYQGNAAKRSPLPPTPGGKENASVSPVRYPSSEPRSPLAGNSAAWK
jgi:hypothetical protein